MSAGDKITILFLVIALALWWAALYAVDRKQLKAKMREMAGMSAGELVEHGWWRDSDGTPQNIYAEEFNGRLKSMMMTSTESGE